MCETKKINIYMQSLLGGKNIPNKAIKFLIVTLKSKQFIAFELRKFNLLLFLFT